MRWIETVQDELRRCTNCGLCLSACPTFRVGRAEGESPRGRVRLLAAMLAGDAHDSVGSQHLTSCIECDACHAPCPTGVRFAVARRSHRIATESLDLAGFNRSASDLRDLIARDPGAALTIQGVRTLLVDHAQVAQSDGPLNGGVLMLTGPMLQLAAPDLVSQLEAKWAKNGPPLVRDRSLSAALDRASGLLLDVGMPVEHDRAIAEVHEIVEQRGYRQLTVAVLDLLSHRLIEEHLPPELRVVPASQVIPLAAWSASAPAVWDGPPGSPFVSTHPSYRWTPLPTEYQAASAPVLVNRGSLESLRELIEAKRAWLNGRTLITTDARNLVRFAGARYLTELAIASDRAGET